MSKELMYNKRTKKAKLGDKNKGISWAEFKKPIPFNEITKEKKFFQDVEKTYSKKHTPTKGEMKSIRMTVDAVFYEKELKPILERYIKNK